jgi:hypothetical protein
MNDANKTRQDWKIAISSWIVQDGNYGNFEIGQAAEFALEFYSSAYQKSEIQAKSAKCLGEAKYQIIGEVIYLMPEVWVIDFGICAFQESKPPEGIEVGSFVALEITLGIDPFLYFETLCELSGMPPLIYSWRINSIAMQTAPFVESRLHTGQNVMIRDQKKLGYKNVSKTDAWKDDDGNAEYVLSCTRLNTPSK